MRARAFQVHVEPGEANRQWNEQHRKAFLTWPHLPVWPQLSVAPKLQPCWAPPAPPAISGSSSPLALSKCPSSPPNKLRGDCPSQSSHSTTHMLLLQCVSSWVIYVSPSLDHMFQLSEHVWASPISVQWAGPWGWETSGQKSFSVKEIRWVWGQEKHLSNHEKANSSSTENQSIKDTWYSKNF